MTCQVAPVSGEDSKSLASIDWTQHAQTTTTSLPLQLSQIICHSGYSISSYIIYVCWRLILERNICSSQYQSFPINLLVQKALAPISTCTPSGRADAASGGTSDSDVGEPGNLAGTVSGISDAARLIRQLWGLQAQRWSSTYSPKKRLQEEVLPKECNAATHSHHWASLGSAPTTRQRYASLSKARPAAWAYFQNLSAW